MSFGEAGDVLRCLASLITHTVSLQIHIFKKGNIRSKKECIRGVLGIFSEGFYHLLGLFVNPSALSV